LLEFLLRWLCVIKIVVEQTAHLGTYVHTMPSSLFLLSDKRRFYSAIELIFTASKRSFFNVPENFIYRWSNLFYSAVELIWLSFFTVPHWWKLTEARFSAILNFIGKTNFFVFVTVAEFKAGADSLKLFTTLNYCFTTTFGLFAHGFKCIERDSTGCV
jgi:hypothetical protein